MEWTKTQILGNHALHACEMCKKRKRKCDRRLPQCSFCASLKSRICQYVESSEITRNLAQPEGPFKSTKNQFPTVFFLDHDIFQQGLMGVPHSSDFLSQRILELFGDDAIPNIASRFFDNTHVYMPIISKKLFYDRYLNPLGHLRTDVLLLCLCMKLFIWCPSENNNPQTQDYLSAKHYIVELEVAGILTLQVLQANLLIALYELGHGIYPSAYLSIGVCATRGLALDLEDEMADCTTHRFTWVEEEERRRVWWAIVILERIAKLGWPSRALATKDPASQDLLPVDDCAWDQGIATENHPINLSTISDTDMGRFARLAIATYLLSRVFRHKAEHFSDQSIKAEESLQLERTIHAAIVLCDLEGKRRGFTCCSPVDICLNALLMLHTTSVTTTSIPSCSENEGYDCAMTKKIAKTIVETSQAFLDAGPSALKEVSPMVLFSPYKAATIYIQLNRESPSEESSQALKTLSKALKIKSRKWRAAGAYMQILNARQVMSTL